MVYAAIEPFGGPADDYRMLMGAATQINRHRKAGSKPVSPLDLAPWAKRETSGPSKRDAAVAIKALFDTAAAGARKRGKRTP